MLLQILSLLVLLIATRILWRRWKYDLHKVPSPPGLPFFGQTFDFVSGQPSYQFSQWIGRCLKDLGYPKLMKAGGMGQYALFVTDLNFIKDVTISKTEPFPKMTDIAESMNAMLAYTGGPKPLLVNATATPYVKAVRKVYATAFQTANLKLALPKVNGVLQNMISIIEAQREKGPVDIQPLFVKMTLDAIGVVAFDTTLGGLDGSREIYRLLLDTGYIVRERLRNLFKKLYIRYFPNTKEAQRQTALIDGLSAEWEKLTTEILERDDPPNGEEPMWHALRSLRHPETNELISRSTLRSEVATIALAGMESTGHQLAWLLGLLACHPDVVDKLLEELSQHGLYGPNAKEVAFEDLTELPYLTAIIKEGMRIGYVLHAAIGLKTPRDMSIFGYRIPKGTFLVCPGTRALHSEEMWGDPHAFRPERWLSGEDMSHKYSIGFAVGPRDCIGQKLAMLEMRLAIVRLITEYHFTLKGTWQELLESANDGLVIEARDGVWLNITPRVASS